jgi:DNA-binding response OmpR family regulator
MSTVARVLVIDDEPDVLLLCRVNLEHAGHQVLVATDGEEGIALARAEHPDVIVLDIMLPQMDGFDVLEGLAGHEETREVPVLLLSARAGREDKVRGLRAGAIRYVTKPFTPTSLASDVQLLNSMTPEERTTRRDEALRDLAGEDVA